MQERGEGIYKKCNANILMMMDEKKTASLKILSGGEKKNKTNKSMRESQNTKEKE